MIGQDYSSIKSLALRLKPGDDLKYELERFVKKEKIQAGCVLTCAGSLTTVALRYANQKETYTLNGYFEVVSLTGTLSVNGSRLHISVSDEAGKTVGGHLKEGSHVYTTAEIIIGIMEDYIFDREMDSISSYMELIVKKLEHD